MRAIDGYAVPVAADLLDMRFERRIAVDDRGGEIDDIPDLQPFGLDRRRQHAIKRRILKVALAPHHCECLAGEHVDHLVPAPDQQPVRGRDIGVRIPDEREIAGGKALRRLDPEHRFAETRDVAGLEIDLLVLQQHPDRGFASFRVDRWNRLGLDPGGNRAVASVIAVGAAAEPAPASAAAKTIPIIRKSPHVPHPQV